MRLGCADVVLFLGLWTVRGVGSRPKSVSFAIFQVRAGRRRGEAAQAGFPRGGGEELGVLEPVPGGGAGEAGDTGEARENGPDEDRHGRHQREEDLLELPEGEVSLRA